MDSTPTAMQDLARRLIALEAECAPHEGPAEPAARAVERLRPPLAKLMGPAGFDALMSRATAMARRDARPPTPGRGPPGVSPAGPGRAAPASDEWAAVLVHLLGLLATFIGEPLTLSLVRDSWPDAMEPEPEPESESDPENGEGS